MKCLLMFLAMLMLGCSHGHEGLREINGTRLFIREVGPSDGPVLLVVHGGPGGNYLSTLPLERLASDFRVVFYDQRGSGQSERFQVAIKDENSFNNLTLQKNIEDIEKIRKYLGKDKLTLIGHSYGGALATFYSAEYPQHVDKLIVYSGGPEDRELRDQKNKNHFSKLNFDEMEKFKRERDLLQSLASKNAPQDELDSQFVKMFEVLAPTLNCGLMHSQNIEGKGGFWANQVVGQYVETFNRKLFARKLNGITAPTLIIAGRCEPSPRERFMYLRDHIPQSKFVLFENSGHNAMEEETELFFKTISSFLGRP